MTDHTSLACIRLFREKTGLDDTPQRNAITDEVLLSTPIRSFDMDSLDTMEFVMAVEDRFDVLLNEESVNACVTLADFTKLVADARSV